MNNKTQDNSGSVSKQTFLATLKRFVEHYDPTELEITETRETESRYQWVAEVKSRLGRHLARQKVYSVEYLYTINGNHFLVETDEHNNLVLAVRIHTGNTPKEMSVWLAGELRKLSPPLSVKVLAIEDPKK